MLETFGLPRLGGGRTRARTWDPLIKNLVFSTRFEWLSCKIYKVWAYQDQSVTLGL